MISQIESFYHVANEKSFTKAARKLNTTQANVSKNIKKLEDKYGTIFFYRTSKNISLTPEGEKFLLRAKNIVDQLTLLDRDLEKNKNEIKGKINFVTTRNLSNEWLSDILDDFCLLYPDVQLFVTGTDTEIDSIEREFDVAFLPWFRDSDQFIQKKVLEFEYGLYASLDYINKHGVPLKIDDLNDHKLIAFDEGSRPSFGDPNLHLVLGMPEGKSRQPIYSRSSGKAMALSCARGIGIALLPKKAPYVQHLKLTPILDELVLARSAGYLACLQQNKTVQRIKTFYDYLHAQIKESYCS